VKPPMQELFFFSQKILFRHHGTKVIVLIDEYDVPLHSGYLSGFYEEAITFIRTFFGSALKDNTAIELAVVTGNLRIAKESVFSDLNNCGVFSVLNTEFSDYFGFTENEITQLLREFQLESQQKHVAEWYNGYQFGETTIYNPWSIVSYILDPDHHFKLHWVNTSDNALIKQLLAAQSGIFKQGLESLMRGESLERPLTEHITLRDLQKKTQEVWSLLLFSGYLKCTKIRFDNLLNQFFYTLEIPNREVKVLFSSIILGWLDEGIGQQQAIQMLKHLVTGEIDAFQELFQTYVLNSLSIFDLADEQPERIYHAFVLGMLIQLTGQYEVKSNQESGFGRYDVMLIPHDSDQLGIIMEFKRVFPKKNETLASAAEAALKQIEEKKYAHTLKSRNVTSILCLGIAFQGKEVLIKEQSIVLS